MVRGTCLSPLLVAGDLFTVRAVSEGELLIDGGLYVIEWSNEAEVQAYRDSINLASKEPVVIAKFLRYFSGEWWCMCRDSFARLDGIVVGMVVGAVSACAPAVHAPESAGCSQIGANAATVLQISSLSGFPGSITGHTGYTGVYGVVSAAPAFSCTVVVTVTVEVCYTGTAGMTLLIGYDDTGGTAYSHSIPEAVINSASPTYQQITLQYQFAHNGANTGPRISLLYNNPGASTNALAYQQISLQVEYILK
jgi:hypothetical protein